MRYVYGITSALLLGGTALALVSPGAVGAQVAQNEDAQMRRVVPSPGAPASFADLTEQLQPAVVNISTRQRVEVQSNPFAGTPFEQFFGDRSNGQPRTQEGQSLGSGFIISADGYVVTNNHVVAPAANGAVVEEITVTMPDRKEYTARVVGRDPQSDLAVLKIDGKNLPFVNFGDSTKARVGDWVITIGNPLGFGGTVTTGIVSALYRNVGPGGPGTGGAYSRYIQTDAAINRGNSGGPLLDSSGRLIGVNSAIYSPTGTSAGVGLAIPVDKVRRVVPALIQDGRYPHPWLGVEELGYELTPALAQALNLPVDHGLLVARMYQGSPADRANLRTAQREVIVGNRRYLVGGDIITAVDGRPITKWENLNAYLDEETQVGQTITLTVVRDGKELTLQATLQDTPDSLQGQ